MKIVFRTDASLQIGTGHVMRCLTLANTLKIAGAQCHFICRELPGNLISLIQQRDFSVRILPPVAEALISIKQGVDSRSNYLAWLGVDSDTDVAQTKVGLAGMDVDWLIVDHYALDARWEQMLRPMCRNLMVIDDLADRPHDCDLLLDQNLGRNVRDYRGLVSETCTILVGPHYALLRPEFYALRDESLHRRTVPKLKHLLITMGGVDQADATGEVIKVLKDCLLPADLNITIVMGLHAPWLKRVRLLAKQMPFPTEVRVSVNNMAELMADSDAAIGAAGTSSWERCCLGLPTLTVVLAENQRNGADALEKSGSVKLLGSVDDIRHTLRTMINIFVVSETLSQLSKKSALVTDGQGASRVKDALSEHQG